MRSAMEIVWYVRIRFTPLERYRATSIRSDMKVGLERTKDEKCL